jgi:hypothetical protein
MKTADEAQELSKKELVGLLQEHGSPEFLKANKVAGAMGSVAKKSKKDALLQVYSKLLAEMQ